MAQYWLVLALCCLGVHVHCEEEVDPIEKLETLVGSLSRQLIMQQLYMEEMTRSGGDSGIKQTRVGAIGTRPYMSNSHTGTAMMAIHDHADNALTVGLGEFVAVLNGIEFRTRHNDYPLKMPHRTSTEFGAVEDLPQPEVPPSVLAKETVEEQIEEMRTYFKAWAQRRTGLRDYRPYFKAALCYLEGAWTTSSDAIDEPFESDRHQIDAKTWFDLTEKVRFTAYSGRKSNAENYAYLPMKIIDVVNGTTPIFAQWNYRILCHPIEENLPTTRMRPIDDFAARMTFGRTMEEHVATRAARFEVHSFTPSNSDREFRYRRGFLDNIFEQIPGYNNYPADLNDDAFGLWSMPWNPEYTGQKLNVGYYHRRYKVGQAGAMGTTTRNRGYADRNVFMAMNTQDNIPGSSLTECTGNGDNEVCNSWHQKWSYAIPLEIIYLTPLHQWNPYNIQYTLGWANVKSVTEGGRNGGLTPEKAYNGTRTNIYYRTPEEFFGSGESEGDPADTAKGTVGVLDTEGIVRRVVASGTRTFFPEIPGLGILRQRYPIAPTYDDGNAVLKEVEALKDLVLRQQTYSHMFTEQPVGGGEGGDGSENRIVEFQLGMSTRDPPGLHTHFFGVALSDMEYMIQTGSQMQFDTSENNGHAHSVTIAYQSGEWVAVLCDGKEDCWDGHPKHVIAEDVSKHWFY